MLPSAKPYARCFTCIASNSNKKPIGQVVGEGNSNPLQYSCLGNPMDRGPWWAAMHGVAKVSDTMEATKQGRYYGSHFTDKKLSDRGDLNLDLSLKLISFYCVYRMKNSR